MVVASCKIVQLTAYKAPLGKAVKVLNKRVQHDGTSNSDRPTSVGLMEGRLCRHLDNPGLVTVGSPVALKAMGISLQGMFGSIR